MVYAGGDACAFGATYLAEVVVSFEDGASDALPSASVGGVVSVRHGHAVCGRTGRDVGECSGWCGWCQALVLVVVWLCLATCWCLMWGRALSHVDQPSGVQRHDSAHAGQSGPLDLIERARGTHGSSQAMQVGTVLMRAGVTVWWRSRCWTVVAMRSSAVRARARSETADRMRR